MTKTEIAKAIASGIVGFATAKVVKEIIRNNTDPNSVTDKVAVVVASYVLGCIAADATSEWTDAKIDEVIAKWQKMKSKDQITV